jgi:allantoinase
MSRFAPPHDRDFAGYRDQPPRFSWPNGARLAVSIVVNVEEGAELALSMGDETNEHVYEAVEKVQGMRDLCMESHFAYGTRAAWPRIRRVLQRYGVTATLNACGRALACSPWLAQEAIADGHEIMCHGFRWERQVYMDEAEERAVIARGVAAIADAAGTPPVGWHTRSATSVNTRRLLVEHGGFLYDCNAYDDDLPYLVEVAGREHVVVPYAFDTNDMHFQKDGRFTLADDFARYCCDAFDQLYAEGGDGAADDVGRACTCASSAGPGGSAGLERFLAHVGGEARRLVRAARRDRACVSIWHRPAALDGAGAAFGVPRCLRNRVSLAIFSSRAGSS